MRNRHFASALRISLIVTLCLFIGTSTAVAVQAASDITISDGFTGMSLETRVDILEDPQGILTVNDVNSEPYASKFIPNPDKNINRGMTMSVYWFRVRLTDNRTIPGKLVLSCNSATLREVTLFLPAANQGENHVHGDARRMGHEKNETGYGLYNPGF